jgi:CRISPR-associated protein Cas1
LPKLRDGLSCLYIERRRVKQKHKAVEFIDKAGRTMVSAAALAVLLLQPCTTITHAAIKALADNGCSVPWTGEDVTRMYAQSTGEARRAYDLFHQAALVSDLEKRMTGSAIQAWSTNSEQCFHRRSYGDAQREAIALDGLQLLRIPSS